MQNKQEAGSASPSRPSIRVLETIESGQASLTPPPSVSGSPGVQHLTPHSTSVVPSSLRDDARPDVSMPREDTLTIVYGEKSQFKRSISEELMYRHSSIAQKCREEAKKLRKHYESCWVLKDELAALSALIRSKSYEEKGVEQQIMLLIERVRDHYPLEDYQARIQELLKDTADDQFTLNNTKPQHNLKTNSKKYKDMVLMSRLRLLDRKGLTIVCDRLIGEFIRIEASENVKAQKSLVTALAQKQLPLFRSSEESVQSLVAWLEHERLHCETDKQLYNLYNLAVRLGIDALSRECLNQLYEKLSDLVEKENARGSSFRLLLGFGEPEARDPALAQPTTPGNTLRIIFERVTSMTNTTTTLSELVSVLLAKHMDLELWEHVKLSVEREFALQIIGAMVAQKEVKAEAEVQRSDQA